MKFRTDISFLRALSVIMVVLFHFQVPGFSGGFIGVDVFFVISGFLMTQIILKALSHNKFSFKNFYNKRTSRIVPPLQLMLWFVLLASVTLLFSADLRLNAKYTVLSSFFVSNIYFWKYLSYFTSGDNILLHTWSLGVEWQFYLLYPVLLFFLHKLSKKNKKVMPVGIAILTLMSLLIMISTNKNQNDFAFYMLPSRFWELSIGATAYFLNHKVKLNKIQESFLIALSVGLIIFCGVYLSENSGWPSLWTTVPVLSAVLILTLAQDNFIFRNPVVTFFGNISYSLYLWHWPLYIVFKNFGMTEEPDYILALICISIAFATLSYNYIEKNKRFGSLKLIGISTLLLTIVGGVMFLKPDVFKKFTIYSSEKYAYVNYSNEYLEKKQKAQFNPCGCYVTDSQTTKDFNEKACLSFSKEKKNILLMGDSHMAQFSASLRKHQEYNWMEVSTGYVLPVLTKNGKKDRKILQDKVFRNFIMDAQKPDLVVISAHWLMRHNPQIDMSTEEVLANIKETLHHLEQHKVNYLIIGQTEAYTLPYPKVVMLASFGRNTDEFLKKEAEDMNEMLKKEIKPAHYIDIYNRANIEKASRNYLDFYMFDGNHFSQYGADQITDKVLIPRFKIILNH